MLRRALFLCFFLVCLPTAILGQALSSEQIRQQAITALQAQIDEAKDMFNNLSSMEMNARNIRNATRAEVNNVKKEFEDADNEYKSALTSLRENPRSQTARRTVDITRQHLEEVNINYNTLEAQAKNDENLWKSVESEMRKEKVYLEELKERMRKLNEDLISPERVLEQIPARFIPEIEPQQEQIIEEQAEDTAEEEPKKPKKSRKRRNR